MEGVDIAQTVVAKIIVELGFSMENVYNMDETRLYYRAKPSKTLAVGTLAQKDWLCLQCAGYCHPSMIHLLQAQCRA